ncbi:hypothetical protein CCH79_00008095 [Gambusia affinis]|uniref:BTB domain-containing protein n=1 Tax=Gambusia affinis TaxID=33528 RepID=A0A315V6T2_GAMAF|nr:hypothetical protein CCH79_00008095 [Gambusia affinis]
MASSPVKSDGMLPSISPKEGQTLTPESSLTWCLAHLCEPGSPGRAEHQTVPSKDTDKRLKMHQWRALVAIRTQHIKGDKAGIARFRKKSGLKVLLNLLKHPECSRKVLDLALSILANCCTELETRLEVRKLEGINIVVDIMKRNVAVETVQNRAARALGNLAMDPESSALIHSAGGVPLLLLCVSLSSAPSSPTVAPPSDSSPKLECAQSAARALLYLSDSPSNRLSLLTQGTLSALAPLVAPEYPPGLRRAALRTLHELTRGCGVECAREVSRSGVLTQLGVMATGESGEHFEELALKTLANVCSQGCLRPLVGSLGVIQRFTEEVKKDPLRSGVFLKALCLCCKEAVNRVKVKENGGLEVLMTFLSSHQNHPLSRFAILACVDFVFDESAMEQLQELGLVPVLVARLAKLARGEEHAADRVDVNAASNMAHNELLPSSCLESFDFPPPEGFRREEAGREQSSSSFLSLRSWLLSEGLISSEGELLDSSCADAEWGSLHSSSSSFQTSSPNPDCSPSPKSTSSSSSAFKKSAPALPPDSSSSSSSSSSDLQTPAASSPVSPSKFSSSQKRRRSHSAASLAKVSIESPPSVPRSGTYHHPYHPEPWTPESPILLLLSRFSHASDPSAALVSSAVMSGLLCYLTQHQDPSSRCFRMLCRLSCNPNCLQALVRTGSVALIRHRLCANEDGSEGQQRQTDRVKTKVKQLGDTLLNNLRVQCESGFGSGVLTHVMLSGSESDRMNCALNKSLLKKLLLDSGGLLAALKPLGGAFDDDEEEEDESDSDATSQPQYFPLLFGCLSALTGSVKPKPVEKNPNPTPTGASPPPLKKPRLEDASCPYGSSDFDLVLELDDATRFPANREAVAGAGSEYFRALLRGGFGEEAQCNAAEAIRIKDVSAGMLLPSLHYLHGCRFGSDPETGGECQTLNSLVLDGLERAESLSAAGFQKSPFGEAMIGASRFLVLDLQRELEEVFLSFLKSWSDQSSKAHVVKSQLDQRGSDPTSSLEVTAQTKKLNGVPEKVEEREASFTGLSGSSAQNTNLSGSKSKEDHSASLSGLVVSLPQFYWFSQRYSYPALGRACLAVLLGFQNRPGPFADCLRRLTREADCTETLKRDLLSLVSAALV